MYILLSLLIAIVLMIIAISKLKIHPFLAILATSIILAFFVGIPINELVKVIETGFSSIIASIGIVIIFGALIGSVLEKTGAALKLADVFVKLLGEKHPQIAIMIIGWIVSIPVFCDSGFILLNPIKKALSNKTGVSYVTMTMALAAGLFASHVFIPPTPGPIAAAGMIGLENNLLLIILLGIVISPFALIPALLFANYIGKKNENIVVDDKTEYSVMEEYDKLIASYGKLPGGFISVLPIILPIILMALATIANIVDIQCCAKDIIVFLGKPAIALILGFIASLFLLYLSGKTNKLSEITGNTLKEVGPIIFITAAGSVLGKVIASTDFVEYIRTDVPLLTGLGIIFPFIIAAILKTAQGSSTVAMTTTASIMGYFTTQNSLIYALGLDSPVTASLAILAIGAGAMTVSHANDSYFWVVTSFSGIKPETGYKTHTLMTLIMGVSSMVAIYIISLFF